MKHIGLQTSKVAMILPIAFWLSGCAHWPEDGKGGVAEHTAAPLYPIEIPAAINPRQDNTITAEQGLRLDADATRQRLDTLVLQGAKICFPAAVYRLNIRQSRIERELSGGLKSDAAIDVLIQRRGLDQLRQQMALVNPDITCQIPRENGEDQQQKLFADISELFNADNQFATGSAAINPKYAARLAKAARQLQALSYVKLSITGHTDKRGNDTHNRQLAEQRAQAVATFLEAMGLEKSRLTITAVASEQPYSQAEGPEHRLVNRRVYIALIQAENLAVTERR